MTDRIWLQGEGRSGTSWLQKIFDHHPETLSLHEPEARLPGKPLSTPTGIDFTEADLRAYASRLFSSRDLRAHRKRPILRKAYRSDLRHNLRVGLIYAASAAELALQKLAGGRACLNVPDLVNTEPGYRVVKCVGCPYPFDAIVAANPEIRFVFILRHPCAVVRSVLHGIRIGKMHEPFLPRRFLLPRYFTFEKGHLGISEEMFTTAELLAYRWAVYNGLAIEAAERNDNILILKYEDLAADPLGVSRDVFAWTGLPWHENCEAFLRASMAAKGDDTSYHGFDRNPMVAAMKWKKEMAEEDQETIRAIARRSPAARLFPDLA